MRVEARLAGVDLLAEPASDVLDFLFVILAGEADGERRKGREWASDVLDRIASTTPQGTPDRATWGLLPSHVAGRQRAERILGGS